MTNQHPITPPLMLRQLWAQQAQRMDPRDPVAWMQHVSAQAAQWGSDQELEACCEVLARELICDGKHVATDLRAVRRPKPPSLNEVALQMLSTIERDAHYLPEITDTIRRALEQLDD